MRANEAMLQYLGVPIYGPSIILGDNMTVVDNTSIANSQLHKGHYVREAFATGEYVYSFVYMACTICLTSSASCMPWLPRGTEPSTLSKKRWPSRPPA